MGLWEAAQGIPEVCFALSHLKYSLHKCACLHVSSGAYVEAATFLFSKISLFTLHCEAAWELQLRHLEQAWDPIARCIAY